MAKQVLLPLGLPSGPSFSNFVVGQNREARAALDDIAAGAGERIVCLWGESGTGKTHLLKAACDETRHRGGAAAYLPGQAWDLVEVDASSELGWMDLVCVDDIGALAGDTEKETALFHLYNLLEVRGKRLLAAGDQSPAGTAFSLRDIASRLAAALVLRLHPIDDDGKREALKSRARERGFTLSDGAITFLLNRCHRDTHSLFRFLDKIDEATLMEKRSPTVPFIRKLLKESAPAPEILPG